MAKKKKRRGPDGPAPKPRRTYGVAAYGIYGVGGYYGGFWGDTTGSGTAQSAVLSGDQFGGSTGDSGGGDGGGGI